MTAERGAQLAHDVGKYVARVARNVPEGGPFVPALGPLLIRDLYELPGGARASRRFEELARELPAHPRLSEARAELSELDALEVAVRAGDPAACLAACARARRVEAALRAYARQERAR